MLPHNFNPVISQSIHSQSTLSTAAAAAVIDLEKYKSLELRLMGCMRTIKNLEKENQAKQDKIMSLTLELDKKSKTIETLNADKLSWS